MRTVLVGAGGHARSVLEAARSAGVLEVVACTDARPELAGTQLDGVPVVGGDEQLDRLRRDGVEAAVLGVGGTGDNGPRARIFATVAAAGFGLPAVVHPGAAVAANARIGVASVVLAAAVVGPGAQLVANVIVNSGAIVEHDCVLADHVHIASGAVLGGDVRVGAGAHVGLGATVLPGRGIGARALVGAGAVVTRDVPEGVVAIGVPATWRRVPG